MLFKHNLFNACLVWILITRDILVQILRSSVSYSNFFFSTSQEKFWIGPQREWGELIDAIMLFSNRNPFFERSRIHAVMLRWSNIYMIRGIKLWEELKFGSLKFWPTKIIDSEDFLVCSSSIPAILSLIVIKFKILPACMHQNIWNHPQSVFIFLFFFFMEKIVILGPCGFTRFKESPSGAERALSSSMLKKIPLPSRCRKDWGWILN